MSTEDQTLTDQVLESATLIKKLEHELEIAGGANSALMQDVISGAMKYGELLDLFEQLPVILAPVMSELKHYNPGSPGVNRLFRLSEAIAAKFEEG